MKTRRILTMYKMHHPKADTDRLHVKGKAGEEVCHKLKQRKNRDN
jgi:hypothetical protein